MPLSTLPLGHLLLITLLSLLCCFGQELCGKLEIHKQKWIGGPGVHQLGDAQRSADLQECLHRCCELSDCSAVSFSGFLAPSDSGASAPPSPSNSASCALFQCPGDCPVVDGTSVADEGLLSVRLRGRERPKSEAKTNSSSAEMEEGTTTKTTRRKPNWEDALRWTTTIQPKIDEGEEIGPQGQIIPLDGGEEEENRTKGSDRKSNESDRKSNESDRKSNENDRKSGESDRRTTPGGKSLLDLNSWDERFPLRADQTPVWAIGLALVATVVCLGLLATLLCTVLCYRRHKLRMRTTQITGGPKKMPTLHAFNPN